MIRFFPVLYLVGMCALFSSTGRAQQWLADRENREGPGIKLGGSLVLHLGLGVEGGFDSNALYAADSVPAGRLRITPYIDLATRSKQRMEAKDGAVAVAPPKATFRLGFATFYDRYFSSANEVDRFNSRFNPFGFDTHLDGVLLPGRKVSFLGGVKYVKTLEPYETSADAQSKHQLDPYVAVRFAPGGGTLTIEPKYSLGWLYFADPRIGTNANRITHKAALETTWKALPKTAFLHQFGFMPTRYYESGTRNVNSNQLRTKLGIQSLIFNKFGIRLMGGYAATFYAFGPDFDGFVGDGSLLFFLTPTARITVGGRRDVIDSLYANYYTLAGGFISYEQMFAGRLLLTARAGLDVRKYATFDGSSVETLDQGTAVRTVTTTDRKDLWTTASLLLEYRAADWFALFLSGRLMADVSNFGYTMQFTDSTGASRTEDIPADFVKFETFFGVRVHY